MVNVLIVEDELSALERITSFNFWSSGPYKIAASARNGREALEKLKNLKVDVVITDIEMPLMNGIAMIRELRKSYAELPVIILSCHESFEYAREAVSLGVRDYILKDFMEENAVKQALLKASPPENNGDSSERTKSNVIGAGVQKVLLALLNNPSAVVSDELKEFQNSRNALIFIHIDGFAITVHEPQKFLEEINYQLDTLPAGSRGFSAYADGGNFWVLLQNEPVSFAEKFFERMKNRKDTFTIAVGSLFEGLDCVSSEAAVVKELFSYRVFLGKNRILFPDSIKSISGKTPVYIRKKIDMVKKAVFDSDTSTCFGILRELYDRDLPGMLKYNYLEYVNLRLLSLILSLSESGIINLKDATGTEYLSIRELEQKETVTEMREWFENLFSRIFKIDKDDAAAKVVNRNIIKVIKIIKNRYNEDLSLEDLALEIGVHKVYLSRLFKKETGRNYYDYLQSYRVHRAELLLGDEGLKMYEVAARTGFKHYDQFAVVFKKLKGIAPSEYRKKLTE